KRDDVVDRVTVDSFHRPIRDFRCWILDFGFRKIVFWIVDGLSKIAPGSWIDTGKSIFDCGLI
ncbi:MAG: hypothetical protein ABI882_22770, partial [Acidobacteriota bacterium]